MNSIATGRQLGMTRPMSLILLLLVLLALLSSVGTAWHLSDQMIKPVHGPVEFPETVERVATSGGVATVSLTRSLAAARPGRYGLIWPGGSAMLGRILAQTPNRVDRILFSGARPTAGMAASLSKSYGSEPKSALDLDFSEIAVPTELGLAPAWYIPATSEQEAGSLAKIWVITVHGSGADRRQSLKFAPIMHSAGLPILDITYRNDLGAPRSSDGLLHLGASEWRDLDAAIGTANSMGARHIVLYGVAMGGAIVLQFLANSRLANQVVAVLLDSPMLSAPRTMDYLGKAHNIPAPLVWLAVELTHWRLGLDMRRVDVQSFPPRVRPPILMLQGTIDEVMPITAARAFASSGPHLDWPIQFAEFPDAGYGEAWNSDPERCEELVRAFLKIALTSNVKELQPSVGSELRVGQLPAAQHRDME